MGAVNQSGDVKDDAVAVHHAIETDSLSENLCRFWELDELPSAECPSLEDAECERLFHETHFRDEQGGYVVCLPRKRDVSDKLGESRNGALRLLGSTERRLGRNPVLKKKYQDFISDYEDLGHMEPVISDYDGERCYLLHHPGP